MNLARGLKAREADCAHLPGHRNRWCTGCGALIIAHEFALCPEGHTQIVIPDTRGPVALWCSGCQGFRDFAA